MTRVINIAQADLWHHTKLSFQIPEFIESIANCRIIAEKAAEAGITLGVEELQQAADDFRLVNHLHDPDATWLWLQKHYLSLDEFEELVHTNVLSSKLAQHLFGNQVESCFYENQLNYAGAVLYEVVLQDEDLAMELFYALQENEISFHDVARQYIQDPPLRRTGGYQGVVHRSDLRPETSAAVFAATPPQILRPIATSKGIHLILVEEIIEPQLTEPLRAQILADLFSGWLRQQREQVEIILDPESWHYQEPKALSETRLRPHS